MSLTPLGLVRVYVENTDTRFSTYGHRDAVRLNGWIGEAWYRVNISKDWLVWFPVEPPLAHQPMPVATNTIWYEVVLNAKYLVTATEDDLRNFILQYELQK